MMPLRSPSRNESSRDYSRCDQHEHSHQPQTTRRQLLLGGVTIATATLAGCLDDEDEDEEVPTDPIALTDGHSCDVCGMLIADHYGPAGQVFYADGKPDDRDGPAWFDSVRELVTFDEEHADRGWTSQAVFVTDYSSVDYQLEEGDGSLHISTHADEASFADAGDLSYVVESAVNGAMGPDYIPFAVDDDADAFVDEHGGHVRGWDELFE